MSRILKNLSFKIDKYQIDISFKQWCHYSHAELLFEVTYEEKKTTILCNVVINDNDHGDDFVNLNINYKEPSYAIGKISSGKRDRQTERETLVGRAVDKIIRPLLSQILDKAITINLIMLNYADNLDLSTIASLASIFCLKQIYNINSAALKIAINEGNEIILFPSILVATESISNITLGANKNQIFYLDLECQNFSTIILNKYIQKGLQYCELICKELEKIPSDYEFIDEKIDLKILNKIKINDNFNGTEFSKKLEISYENLRQTVSAFLAKENTRINKRKLDEIRPIAIEAGPIKRNNNVIFSRGKTVVLGIINYCNDKINIGETIRDEQNIISVYNFPGFSTGSTFDKKSIRRELAHGDLIRGAFQKVTSKNISMRAYAEVLSADGSTSMASVCAISAAGTQMGVFPELVAGISIGIFRNAKKEIYVTDISAIEDQYSEADFKITGSKSGITAIRADTKSYIQTNNVLKIMKQGELAIKKIIDKMEKGGFKNDNQITNITIDKKKLGMLIGTNGKNIKELSAITNCKIKTNQDGNVCILGEETKIAEYFIRAFQEEGKLQSKDIIGFIIKENSNGKICQTSIGDMILTKNTECKKGEVTLAKIKDWTTKEVSIYKVISQIIKDEKTKK